MKEYEAPFCEVDLIEMERSFLTGASAEGFSVDKVDPFGNSSSGTMMEDDYE